MKKTKGGAREGAGRRFIDPMEKKVTVAFQIKRKHIVAAKDKLQPIIDKINSK